MHGSITFQSSYRIVLSYLRRHLKSNFSEATRPPLYKQNLQSDASLVREEYFQTYTQTSYIVVPDAEAVASWAASTSGSKDGVELLLVAMAPLVAFRIGRSVDIMSWIVETVSYNLQYHEEESFRSDELTHLSVMRSFFRPRRDSGYALSLYGRRGDPMMMMISYFSSSHFC